MNPKRNHEPAEQAMETAYTIDTMLHLLKSRRCRDLTMVIGQLEEIARRIRGLGQVPSQAEVDCLDLKFLEFCTEHSRLRPLFFAATQMPVADGFAAQLERLEGKAQVEGLNEAEHATLLDARRMLAEARGEAQRWLAEFDRQTEELGRS